MPTPTEPSSANPLSPADIDQIAARFHFGQTDKSGRPYIEHPRAVAEAVAAAGGTLHQQMAALLHDVVEDTEATLATLESMGVAAPVLVLVDAMTKRDGESHEDYLRRLSAVPGAVLIKRADIAHNSHPHRLALLSAPTRNRLTAKYQRASWFLDRLEGGDT